MTDLSQLSDDQLKALYGQSASPLAGMSNEDLIRAHQELSSRPPPKPFNILPFSENENGKVSFDINAGLPGALIRAVKAPYDALTGKFDPLSPEGQERALETALTISPASTAMRAGERVIPGVLKAVTREEPKPPTAEALKDTAGAQYKAVKETGAQYPGQSVGELSNGIQRSLNEEGFLAELAPKTFAILGKLTSPPEGSVVTISSLDAARKALNRVAPNPQDNTDFEAARRVIGQIDDFIQRGGQTPSVAGAAPPSGAGAAQLPGPAGAVEATPEAEAARIIPEARGNAAARFRSDRITGKAEVAGLRADASASGQNLGNSLRQRLVDILASDKLKRGYSQEELDAMERVVKGTATSNTLRYVGNLLGGGGGIGQAGIGLGGAATGLAVGGGPGAVAGAALPLVGAASRAGYNRLVRRQVENLDELVRKRSPLYQALLQDAPVETISPERRAALMRALLLTGVAGNGSQ